MIKKLQNNRGFTLIETMIALAFLSVALLGSSALYIRAAKTNSVGNKQSTATFIARSVLEEFKSSTLTNFDSYATNKGGNYNSSDFLTFTDRVNEKGQEDSEGIYTRIVDITKEDGYRIVKITIKWPLGTQASDGMIITGMIRGEGL